MSASARPRASPPPAPTYALFDAFPALGKSVARVALGTYPSAIEPAPKVLDERLYVKRDDTLATLFGGGKVRKLELYFGEARALGKKRIVTFGGVGSNQALAAALLIAPSAYHRLTFRYQQKHRLVFISNRLAIAGLAVLALAMTCAIMLVTNVLFGTVATTVVTTFLVLSMFLVLWAVLPLRRRLKYRNEGLPLLDPPREG